MMHAITHTKGVVLNKTYIPLELAYQDVTGLLCHFHITSPMTYSKMRRMYPHCRPDVEVSINHGIPYSEVLKFLKNRHESLQQMYPYTSIIFGYKGEMYQPQILKDAAIPNIVNVERYGVPPLHPVIINDIFCSLHKGNLNKCALVALNQIVSFFQ